MPRSRAAQPLLACAGAACPCAYCRPRMHGGERSSQAWWCRCGQAACRLWRVACLLKISACAAACRQAEPASALHCIHFLGSVRVLSRAGCGASPSAATCDETAAPPLLVDWGGAHAHSPARARTTAHARAHGRAHHTLACTSRTVKGHQPTSLPACQARAHTLCYSTNVAAVAQRQQHASRACRPAPVLLQNVTTSRAARCFAAVVVGPARRRRPFAVSVEA